MPDGAPASNPRGRRRVASRLHLFFSRVHKLMGLLLVVQFLFWTTSGVIMSWIPIQEVRGEHLRRPAVDIAAPPLDIVKALARVDGTSGLREITLRDIAGRHVIETRFADGTCALIDMATGRRIPVDATLIAEAARAAFAHAPLPLSIDLLDHAPIDYRGPVPVWRVAMDDADGTVAYLDPETAHLRAVRTDTWRLYDFFWMLHIMDYESRDDFNNPLIMTASLSAALFVLSGIALLIFRLRQSDFRLV